MKFTVGQLLLSSALALGSVTAWWQWPAAAQPVEARAMSTPEKQAVASALRVVSELSKLRQCASASCAPLDDAFARRVATEARFQLDSPDLRFRDDCSGYVSAVFSAVGVEMDGVVASIYDLAAVHGTIHWSDTPRVGDLVFFDDTHDRNGDGLWDDTLTHIGLVVDVEPDGTAVYAHAGTSQGRALGRINVERPFTYKDADGRVINTYLREPAPGDPQVAGYLSGALWVGFATVHPELDWRTPPPPPESWP